MARKVTKRDIAALFVNSLGVFSYVFMLLSYVLPLTVLAGVVMALTRRDDAIIPVEIQQGVPPVLDATSQFQAVIATSVALVVVALVVGLIAWVVLKVPLALFRFSSRIVHVIAGQLSTQPTVWTLCGAKLFVAIMPAALMFVLYALLWEYTVMVPLLALTGLLAAAAIVLSFVQVLGAQLSKIPVSRIL